MREQQYPYPTDRDKLNREYSPSRLVDSLDDYLSQYARRSVAAREQLAGTSSIGLKYGSHHRHRLDYFPAARANAPLVVFFHGGFWSALDESSFSFPATVFNAAGVNFVSATYRLAPETRLTGIVADARQAIRWLLSRSPQLGFDPDQIIIAGHSAGAHLAAMVMTSEPALCGAVLISGVYDLEPVRLSYVNDTVRMYKGEAEANSPVATFPLVRSPVHIAVGSNETAEFKRQSALLYDTWSGHLPSCELAEYDGRDHFDIVFDLANPSSQLFGKALNLVNRNAP